MTTEASSAASTEATRPATIDLLLEVVTLPVADADRAKAFYEGLGWRLDADLNLGEGIRNIQFTPPHSQCSIHLGQGTSGMEPGSLERIYLAVEDIDAAREDLMGRGVEVSEVEEQAPPPGFEGPDRSYFATATFQDPDGNGFLLQEIKTRLPGREWED